MQPMTPPKREDDAMGTDKLVRSLTTTAVLLVAAIAAVVSFLHIEQLALSHGQERAAAVLLPLSIDGTVAAASLVMLRAARASLPTPSLARFMLVLSVTATLLANIAYGAPFGLTGALISGWPAVAFVGCVEMTIGMVRRTRAPGPVPVPDALPDHDTEPEPAAVLPVAAAVPSPRPARTPPAPRQKTGHRDKLDRVLSDPAHHGKTNAELAAMAKVSSRTVSRRKAARIQDSVPLEPESVMVTNGNGEAH
jgi:Protein of unknown function (DUF2637)